MKIISWNVNGLRSVLKKGFVDFMLEFKPDVLCIQETKAAQDQVGIDLPDYIEYWNSALRKGYSGTAVFSKQEPLGVYKDFEYKSFASPDLRDEFGDAIDEGRLLTVEYKDFFVVNVYTPNAKRELERLDFRFRKWDRIFLNYLQHLEKVKPLIVCGDFNVAHEEIDLARPKDNHHNAGFTDEEREGFGNIIKAGFVDTFRIFNKEGENYTWWSYFHKARERNIGWRIDYILASESLKSKVKSASILDDVYGSDHCPVGIEI
jgi:exodeoxyribonuclease III